MPPFQRPRKLLPYAYALELDGRVCARFQAVSGLDVPYGAPRTTLTLRRGVTTGQALPAWRRQGNFPLRNGSLVMVDESGVEKGRWRLEGGRISKWTGPTLAAKGSGDVAIQILELTCERIDVD